MSGPSVAICIPSYRRPEGLHALLGALDALAFQGPAPEIRIVVVDNGTVRASGTHDELVASDSMYADFAATQLLAGE